MTQKKILNIALYLLSAIAVLSLVWWLMADPTSKFTESLPGLDKRAVADSVSENVEIGKVFNSYSTGFKEMTETWTRFRGNDFDNISKSPLKLKEKFGPKGADIRWSVQLGEGHSGATIYKGLVYLLDYNEKAKADLLRCFSLTDGKELWQRGYNISIKRNHGMSRTIPAITDKYILTMGPRCQVMCLDRATGNFRWGIDVAKEYSSEIPFWYTGQCPMIDNDVAIIATGGKALMIGVSCETGKKLWEVPNPDGWKMSHSSVMPFTFGGQKMYVYSAIGGLIGVAADGSDVGKVLWKTLVWNHSVVAPSPVCMPDGKIFMTAGYGAGAMMLQLKENNGNFTIGILQEYLPRFGLACEQQTPVYWQGHLFGILPKDAGSLRNQFVCVDPADCKKMVWTSGQTARFGLGPFFIADNKFFILDDEGTLTIIKPSTSKYIQLDQVKVIKDGTDAWAPLAIADGYLLLRDSKTMVCVNMNL
jgi:outer membrane protein assembly factor BamB